MGQTVSKTPAQEAAPKPAPCPRCQQPLLDPLGLGWCKACGYCRSLEEAPNVEVLVEGASAPATPAQPGALAVMVGSIRLWAVALVVIGALLVAGTYAVARYSHFKPFDRAVWTTLQILAGLALMFLGQLIALMRIAPEDPSLTIKDAIFPFRLYGLILRRLPGTCWCLYLIAWGAAISLAAMIFIGGLDHWMTYLPGRENDPAKTTKTRRY